MPNYPRFKVYQASAGAGKTFTLIKEYLKLCLADENAIGNYKRILAITFTNAAANEMKDKIVKALLAIIGSETVDPKSMEAKLLEELGITDTALKRNAQALMNSILHDYSSFCVSTIDAFVQKLSRSFAHELGLPNQYNVSIDTEELAEAITEKIGMEISDQDAYLTQLLVDFSNNQYNNERSTAIEKQLADFVVKLTSEKAYRKDGKNGVKDALQYKQTLGFLNDRMRDFEQKTKTFVDAFRAIERSFGLTVDDYWQKKSGVGAFVGKLEKKDYGQPNSYFHTAIANRKCLGDTSKEEANDALLGILAPFEESYADEYGKFMFYKSQRNLLYLYALRTQISAAFNQLAEEEEIVHISEFNKLLNSVMGDFTVPFVYERIGEQYQHVFVDEFQDTSILQWQNLLPLVDNSLANGKMSMLVGDGKQSIYRFRSGEVEQITHLPEIYAMPHDERKPVFMQYERNLKDNFLFQNLGTNYRSFVNVVGFNNAFFEFAHHELSANHRKVYVSEKPCTDEGVSIFQKTDKTEEGMVQIELYDAENQPDYCCERVADIVGELVNNFGYRYEDIAVLTRKSDLGAVIANCLNDRNVPVISQVSVLLKSSDKVQLLVNTLRYLLHDDNEVDVANVLYYWNVLQCPAFKGDVSRWFDEARAVAKGEVSIEMLMGLGESGLLKAALSKATCVYDLCAALMRIYRIDTVRDAFLNYFMEEVFKSQSGIKDGIGDFLSHWDAKQDKLSVMSVSGNAVKIMTIHKSKGLEFPVVIYPEAIIDLDERLNPSKPAEVWLRPEDLGFEAIPNMDTVLFRLDSTAESMGGKALEKVVEEKESNRLDNLNLLYVAFTRAVQRLYVIAKQGKPEKPNLLRDFLADKSDRQVQGDGALVYRFGHPDFSNPKENATRHEPAALTDSISSDWLLNVSVNPTPTSLWHRDSERLLPREWGELVHQLLSGIRFADEMESMLSPTVSDGTIDGATAAWIREKFNLMASHPLIAPAFSSCAKVKTECEVLYQGDVRRLDRYAELQDVVYLIDYKTGKKNPKHEKQLNDYVAAIKSMTEKEIWAFLVYLSGAEIEVEGPMDVTIQ